MKQNIVMLLLAIATSLLVISVGYMLFNKKIDKKYRITYPHGSSSFWDYTDTFHIEGNVIYYVDEHNKPVIRSGTYGIEKVVK